MRWVPFLLLICAGAVLEAGSLLSFISFHEGQIKPALLLIFLVFFAVHPKLDTAIISSFVIGFAADLAGSAMGPYTICYGLAGSLLAQMGGVMTIRHPLHQVGLVFAAGVFTGLSASWMAAAKSGVPSGLPVSALLGIALYSALAAPLLWPFLRILAGYLYVSVPSRSRSASSLHV